MKKLCVVLAAAFMAACLAVPARAIEKTPGQMVKEAKAAIREVSVGDLKKMIDAREKIVILDVRDKSELTSGRIPGAINISRGTLEFKAGMMIPDRNARIVVYCGVDLRGPLATRTLNELGYVHAINLIGGLTAWQAAGYPLEH
jgi:sulfur-carrier protein adenylyltransferase/sulfurtransferase